MRFIWNPLSKLYSLLSQSINDTIQLDTERNSVPVIDVTQISSEGSVAGRKKETTLVRRANGG